MSAKPPEPGALLTSAPSESTPFLLELARAQAGRRRPADLLRQREADRFVHPSMLDARMAHTLDGLALDAAEGYEALLLSPVAPLGTCSVVAPTSQDRTLSTTRGTEVVSDPTNVLALEAARRLRADPAATVRLCAVHQVLRAQPLPPGAGFSRHFRLLVLAEAGPAEAEDAFEVGAVVRQAAVLDRLFESAMALGCRFPGRRFAVHGEGPLAERVAAGLRRSLPHPVELGPPPKAYYAGLKVSFFADSRTGEPTPLGDTGRFGWVAALTANRRHRYVASGFGLQLLPLLFR
jgi:hypothetical protein